MSGTGSTRKSQAQAQAPSQMERITLTPEMATELLDGNTLNRPISDVHVNRIANQISAGKWRFNGDTIKIAADRRVLDGQHRCWAVIEARTAIDTIIVRNIEPEAFSTIDTLRKPRSGADILSLCGAERHRHAIAQTLIWLIRWQEGIQNFKEPSRRVENADIENAYGFHKEAVTYAVEKVGKLRRVGNVALLAFLFYIISNRDSAIAERMVDTLYDPSRLPVSDPFYQLRRYFLAREMVKNPLTTIALTIKAANAAKRGRQVENLQWKTIGRGAEKFPELFS
jgi:hypothetical protein